MPWGVIAGLDLETDELSPSEYDQYAFERCSHFGYPQGMPIWQVFRDHRPELVKSNLKNLMGSPKGWSPELGPIAVLLQYHLYMLRQFPIGVLYELRGFQATGWSRGEMMDTIAVVNLQAVSMGLNDSVGLESIQLLKEWQDPPTLARHFPSDWSTDREVLRSGIDYSEPGMSDEEVRLLEDWYERVAGEVPAWIPYLAQYDRNWLKTVRMRWEQALQVQPVQMLPLYLLHYDMLRGFSEGFRENVLLARGLGVSKRLLLDVIHFGGKTYGGTAPISMVANSIGDILRDW